MLRSAAFLGCGCMACAPRHATAFAALSAPPPADAARWDVPRDAAADGKFAEGMAFGMRDYEAAVRLRKAALFRRLFAGLRPGSTVVELGLGAFPNAPFYRAAPAGLDIVGVDPNDRMEPFARRVARDNGLLASSPPGAGVQLGATPPSTPPPCHALRVVHGVGEALPLADRTADAVVCTLTLCSVLDPARTLAEVRRVLRPGGKLLFHEHVLSETDGALAEAQERLTPAQVKRADGCHLNRRTLRDIEAAGFKGGVEAEYYELKDFLYLNPTVSGIATA